MARIKVLVVDDSVVIRRLVTDVLAADPEIEVVGTAVNGKLALDKLPQLTPDVLTMDIEMPVMDGVEAVRQLRASGSRLPVVMFSTLTERGAVATLEALSAGASDYVTKPANTGSVGASMEQVREQLIPKIKALVPIRRAVGAATATARAAAAALPSIAHTARPAGMSPTRRDAVVTTRPVKNRSEPFRVLAIGCSTGGPEALSRLLAALPASLPVPIVVVQHMPPVFTAQFAARLDRSTPFQVVEAIGGEDLAPGRVFIAPGDHHLSVTSSGGRITTRLTQAPPENFCRPAVDVLFRSVAEVFGSAVLAAVLTGMGADGRSGADRIVSTGGSVLVQDESSSVVWGMPGAVAGAGLAEEILPLVDLAPALGRRLGTGRRPAAAVGAS